MLNRKKLKGMSGHAAAGLAGAGIIAAGIAAGSGFQSCAGDKGKPKGKPNIILIVGDDIGFSDIGCYGSEIETPNLDRLGNNGIRFTQFYNMAKCNPTRSSLLTGLYFGDHRAASLPQMIKQAGYTTLASGKEHFDGWVPDRCYFRNSFERSFYFWAINEYHIPPDSTFQNPFVMGNKELEISEIEYEKEPFFKTDVLTDYALRFVDGALSEEKPFFLYLPYHVAHYPLQARPEDIAKYRGTYRKGWDKVRQARFERMKAYGLFPEDTRLSEPTGNVNKFRGHPSGDEDIREKIPLYRPWDSLTEDEKDKLDLEMAVYAAMIDRMDRNIGRIMDKIENEGLLENTLIMFFSDNGSCPFDSNRDFEHSPGGPASYRTLCAAWANVGNTPFRYFKQFGHEGGSNTHFIVHWPAVIDKGMITGQQAHLVDIFPTLLEITGQKYPDRIEGENSIPLSGSSLMPIFRGKTREEPEFLVSGFTERFRMYREGDWKLVRKNAGSWELYNIEEDPTETNDLAEEKPDIVSGMAGRYNELKREWELYGQTGGRNRRREKFAESLN